MQTRLVSLLSLGLCTGDQEGVAGPDPSLGALHREFARQLAADLRSPWPIDAPPGLLWLVSGSVSFSP